MIKVVHIHYTMPAYPQRKHLYRFTLPSHAFTSSWDALNTFRERQQVDESILLGHKKNVRYDTPGSKDSPIRYLRIAENSKTITTCLFSKYLVEFDTDFI